jgi:hypothetical protein
MKILDMACGSRMFWFDKDNPNAIYLDRRVESHTLNDKTAKSGQRALVISPTVQANFTALPFADCTFNLVVFDPPHFDKLGASGWIAKKYGMLFGDWRTELAQGFAEAFRVLAESGTLVFKWNEAQIPLSEVLKLAPYPPLFGHMSGKQQQTHWITFGKVAL